MHEGGVMAKAMRGPMQDILSRLSDFNVSMQENTIWDTAGDGGGGDTPGDTR
jgi:hypothetical protein